MNQYAWVSLISLAGFLILALSAYRAHRIDARKTVVLALVWIAIFFAVAGVFAAIGGRSL